MAQTAIGAKPGTKRAELAAVLAICGAAVVRLISLVVFVGILGTWLVRIIPPGIVDLTRSYILPAILGAVLVQAIVAMKQPRSTLLALGVSAVATFGVVPLAPGLGLAATAVVVMATATLAWLLRDRSRPVEAGPPAEH
jgi:hypothetical protein